jgi:hypothetical protein
VVAIYPLETDRATSVAVPGGEAGDASSVDSTIANPVRLDPASVPNGWALSLRLGDVVAVSGVVGRGFIGRGNALVFVSHVELLYDTIVRVARRRRRVMG